MTGLVCKTDYRVRVRAYGDETNIAAEWGSPSESVSGRTGTCVAPTFGSASYSFSVRDDAETERVVGTIAASGSLGVDDAVTYAVTEGNDDGYFALDESTGEITVAAALTELAGTTYTLTVEAEDESGGAATVPVTITVEKNCSSGTAVPSPTATMAATQTPTSDAIPTPAPLPDLVIEIAVRLKSNPRIEWGDGCIVSSSANLPFHIGEITARVSNVGGGDAGSFTVQLNDAVIETVDGLRAGASATLVVSTSLRSENVAVVDADSSIDESDESNNTAETFIPVPTLVPPAPTCTPSR